MSGKYRTLQTYMLWFIDMVCIIATYGFATWLRYNNRNDWGDKTQHYMVCVVFLLFCTVYSLMADWNRDFLVRGYIIEFLSVVRFVAVVIIGSISVVYFLKWVNILSRYVIVNYIWMDVVLTYIVRIIFKKIYRRHISSDSNAVRVVVVAERALLEETVKKLQKAGKFVGLRVVRAYCVDGHAGAGDTWDIDGVHVHYGIENLTERLITDPFDEVFINTPNIPQREMEDIICGFEEMGVTTHYNLELPDVGKATTSVDNYMNYTVITYSMFHSSYKRLIIKRLVDIIGAIVGLVLTGIITLFLAPAIKLDSKGPVFFSQVRIGKNGRRFKIYKFRSMYIDAEERLKDLQGQNEMNGLMFKMEDDPRVTKVGKFIRKTSLDEFPQFLNVLKGDMSLVGTRPPTEAEFKQYNEHYRRRLSMTPGLTGLWQISGRSDIQDFDEVVKLDLKYIDNWSLTEDFKILLSTVGVVLFGKGAK
ncbi:sugar transferase [Butyrivibrio proteoclasticus]|uniref:sugar transferase n=1 Tax=Butyrivibrio proteoclasticus TaxID=43305 RepID=UPI00047964BF|nr:sugar transferase [Butyrivibrio proteoclasticus]